MMRTEIKNILKLFIFLFCFLPVWTWAASYEVSTITSTVDGNTFCGGSPCTSADTIIIKGGTRGNLRIQNFNGNGSYITIANEDANPDSRVVINNNDGTGYGVLSIYNCKYIDLNGNNDADLTYGIKVENDNDGPRAGTVWVYGESDHIKLSYMEIDCVGNTSTNSNGIQVQDGSLTTAWTFSNFEIHHNYIHDTRYAGMYLGHNDPDIGNDPYVGTFSIHHNILEDLGAYGITYKGVHGADNYIYNNTVKTTGLVRTDLTGDAWHGIGTQMANSDYVVEVFNNWIEATKGPGIKVGESNGTLVYNNIILGCGTGDEANYGHGIINFMNPTGLEIYDNIIVEPKRYGFYNLNGVTGETTLSRNLIGDAGIGEWGEKTSGDTTESSGVDANIYHADVADFHFPAWSDDGNYSNDVFSTTNAFPWPEKDSLHIKQTY